jgi:hypothetical protein
LQVPWFKIHEDLIEEISEEDTVSYIILHQLKNFAKKWDIILLWQLSLEVLSTNATAEKIEKVEVRWNDVVEEKE